MHQPRDHAVDLAIAPLDIRLAHESIVTNRAQLYQGRRLPITLQTPKKLFAEFGIISCQARAELQRWFADEDRIMERASCAAGSGVDAQESLLDGWGRLTKRVLGLTRGIE